MPKVIVGMSGGVDSSVAALLLRNQGYDVRGVFMKNYEPPPNSNQPCPWEQDQADVATICEQLGIPWESWNFEKAYTQRVLEYFFREYEAGRTPNPDVMCNREIKFGTFLERAKQEGYDYIATGHYAAVAEQGGTYELQEARDRNKDQTYFLHTLGQTELARTLFPLGKLQKSAVRALAAQAGLATAHKPDSQGICFIGQVDVVAFLKQRLRALPGPVVTSDGEVIGEHQGLPYYTIGQRHGLGVGGGVPYYVAAKDLATNTLTVARGNQDPILHSQGLVANAPHWVSGRAPAFPLTCTARIRYRQPLTACTVTPEPSGLTVVFAEKQRAVTPGQAVVFYHQGVCLGGATIERAV